MEEEDGKGKGKEKGGDSSEKEVIRVKKKE